MRDRRRLAAGILLLLGVVQMGGDLAGIRALTGLGAALTASPAPRVFSAVDGFETYSSRFFFEIRERNGKERVIELTPEIYARLRGPYNRRNVYGAILAYGPVLASRPETSALFEKVLEYSLCGRAPLLEELGLDPGGVERVRVRLAPLANPGDLPLVFEARCEESGR